jgi:hypothetical protein
MEQDDQGGSGETLQVSRSLVKENMLSSGTGFGLED